MHAHTDRQSDRHTHAHTEHEHSHMHLTEIPGMEGLLGFFYKDDKIYYFIINNPNQP